MFFNFSIGKKKKNCMKVVDVYKIVCDEEVVKLVNEDEFKVKVVEVVE